MSISSKKIVNYLIILSTIIISINFLNFVSEKSLVQYSDWLINYQGGFVRRGFIGEIFFQLYKISTIPLDIIVSLFVIVFYALFALLFIKILKKIKLDFLNLLIIFSPISFLYPVMEQKVSGRKDIMFILAITILIFFLEKVKFKNQKYLVLLLALIVTFSHSGFFVYLPLFILIFIIINHKERLKHLLIEIAIIVVFFGFLFIAVMLNTAIDESNVKLICISIQEFQPRCGSADYIETLSWTFANEIKDVKKIINKENYILFYSLAFSLFSFPLGYSLYKSEILNKKNLSINLFYIFILINAFTFPLYYVGGDYGRYMYLSYLSLSIIYFKAVSIKLIKPPVLSLKINKYLAILIIFLYGFVWTVPHCCNNNFKFIYNKPLSKIANFYNL